MARTGRPPVQIDEMQFRMLCQLLCTETDIADFFHCSIDTINNWCKKHFKETFSEVYKRESTAGRISLRRKQMKLAEKSASMAIFLGKNYLGQTDGGGSLYSDSANLPEDPLSASLREEAERMNNDVES